MWSTIFKPHSLESVSKLADWQWALAVQAWMQIYCVAANKLRNVWWDSLAPTILYMTIVCREPSAAKILAKCATPVKFITASNSIISAFWVSASVDYIHVEQLGILINTVVILRYTICFYKSTDSTIDCVGFARERLLIWNFLTRLAFTFTVECLICELTGPWQLHPILISSITNGITT